MTAPAPSVPPVSQGLSAHTAQHSFILLSHEITSYLNFSLSKVDGCSFYLPGVRQDIIGVCQNCPAKKFQKDTKHSFKRLTYHAFLTFPRLIQHRLTPDRLGWKCAFLYYRQQLPALITPIAKSITLELWCLLCLSVHIVRGRITVATWSLCRCGNQKASIILSLKINSDIWQRLWARRFCLWNPISGLICLL